jgi:hypothetical protein
MMSRIFTCLAIGFGGINGLLPVEPQPATGQQLQAKAKQASKDKICAKAKRRKKTLELCKKWGLA